ncbi:MAG: DNA polymerase IV, partial [Candidatus Cloacimonetes bacterium]|nr:DNA polymerase IV [Candidatus Cloacimonadota bacterium]
MSTTELTLAPTEQKFRKIIHVDMDMYFAAIELRDHPEYRGKPLVIGGAPNSRGVVSTASYEARKFGIHSAMASSQAYRLCPQAIFTSSNSEAIKEATNQIREIFSRFTDLVQPVSSDEAYLDVTKNHLNQESATEIAKEIRRLIVETTRLTASAGVSYNKLLAKIASEYNKPDGLFVIRPDEAVAIIESLTIGKFHGIGKVTARKMKKLGIYTGSDLKDRSLKELLRHFGKVGYYYYNISRGVDNRLVETEHERKSYGRERTFSDDINDMDEMLIFIRQSSDKITAKLIKENIIAMTIT